MILLSVFHSRLLRGSGGVLAVEILTAFVHSRGDVCGRPVGFSSGGFELFLGLCLNCRYFFPGVGLYNPGFRRYTGGRGRLLLELDGYDLCHDPEAVIAALGYDPERDVENTPDSVFCAHGGGFPVKWDRVKEYMHLESCLK